MKNFIIILLFVTCLSCSKECFGQDNSSDYYPLKIGNNWTYVSCNLSSGRLDTIVYEIVGKINIGGRDCFEFKITENAFQPGKYFYYSEFIWKDGINVFSNQYGNDQLLYKFDADTGSTWEHIRYSSDTTTNIFTIYKKNYDTKLNKKEYKNCVAISSKIEQSLDSDIFEEFALGIGRIRIFNTWGDDWKLTSYQVSTDVSEQNPLTDNLNIIISSNPTADFIEISVGAIHELPLQSIQIFSALGVKCREQACLFPTDRKYKIDVSGLPSGIYFVRVGDKVGKFVKI